LRIELENANFLNQRLQTELTVCGM